MRRSRPADLEGALANIPGQDADCEGLIGVNVYGSAARSRTEREEHDAMREIEIHDYARQLLEAHGARAIAEAAQNAIDLEAKGEWNWPEPGGISMRILLILAG